MSCNLKEDLGYIKKDICLTNNLDIIKLLIEEGLNHNATMALSYFFASLYHIVISSVIRD